RPGMGRQRQCWQEGPQTAETGRETGQLVLHPHRAGGRLRLVARHHLQRVRGTGRSPLLQNRPQRLGRVRALPQRLISSPEPDFLLSAYAEHTIMAVSCAAASPWGGCKPLATTPRMVAQGFAREGWHDGSG